MAECMVSSGTRFPLTMTGSVKRHVPTIRSTCALPPFGTCKSRRFSKTSKVHVLAQVWSVKMTEAELGKGRQEAVELRAWYTPGMKKHVRCRPWTPAKVQE